MHPKLFVNYILFCALILVSVGFSINCIVDPYSVFGTKFFPEYGQMQERYLKIEYLNKNSNFNTFLMGSSRVGAIRTEFVDQYFPGAASYNLTVSAANQWDIEKHVEWLLKNVPTLTHVIVQIDWPNAYGPDNNGLPLMRALHPDLSGRAKHDFLLDYLTKFNLEAMREKIKNNYGGLNQIEYDMTKGYWSWPLRNSKIEENCNEYVVNEKTFHGSRNVAEKVNPSVLNSSLASIARYKKLLDAKNVKLTVLLTPQNQHKVDPIVMADYEFFVSELVKITDFYNFMYYNKLTKNDCNYYETTHYRPVVGELVIKSLAEPHGNRREIYQYVTKESLPLHIDFLKENFISERVKWPAIQSSQNN